MNHANWPRQPRLASAVRDDGAEDVRAMHEWRDEPAYVLLGDPGSGKSWTLDEEAQAANTTVYAAQVIAAGLQDPARPDAVVFIDGLDEVRGSAAAGSDALAVIARWLKDSGSPRFRISCREADWHGSIDRELLQHVSPNRRVTALHLKCLTDAQIRALVEHAMESSNNAAAFLETARRHGLDALLANPLLLQLTIDAVTGSGGRWPESKADVYEAACRRLADEHSATHRQRQLTKPGHIDHVLDDAGLLFAVLLLSGKSAVLKSGLVAPDVIDLRQLPEELALHDANAAMSSNLFRVDGGRASAMHRTVAEYLAARSIARRVTHQSLPLARALALIQGLDGRPLESMRGLFGWLAVHLRDAPRHALLQADPLAVIVNGDVAMFSESERTALLRALSKEARWNRWFRAQQWIEHPFGPLATTTTAQEIAAHLAVQDRSQSQQAFVDCLLDALSFAREQLPALAPLLAIWIEDPAANIGLRITAYTAWRKHCPLDAQALQLASWLDSIVGGSVRDPDDRLMNRILRDAYPSVIGKRVLQFLNPPKNPLVHLDFWSTRFLAQTPPDLLPEVADEWTQRFQGGLHRVFGADIQQLAENLLCAVLDTAGDHTPVVRLYAWLGIGLDQYGLDRPGAGPRDRIQTWLAMRPKLVRELLEHGYSTHYDDEQATARFWAAEIRLRGAPLPPDAVHGACGWQPTQPTRASFVGS